MSEHDNPLLPAFPALGQYRAPDLDGWFICGASLYSPRKAVRRVFGAPEDAARELTGRSIDMTGSQILYLWRRFGPPIHPWDGTKELIGYYLTTPDPEVLLYCSPEPRLTDSIAFGLKRNLDQALSDAHTARRQTGVIDARDDDWEPMPIQPNAPRFRDHPLYQRIDQAITQALAELLRPIVIDGRYYSYIGPTVRMQGVRSATAWTRTGPITPSEPHA